MSQRIEYVYRRVLARAPDAEELTVMEAGLARHRAEFAADLARAKELLSVGAWPVAKKLDAVEHAAWTLLCLSVLNFDETLNKG